jgi:hypothetical protein
MLVRQLARTASALDRHPSKFSPAQILQPFRPLSRLPIRPSFRSRQKYRMRSQNASKMSAHVEVGGLFGCLKGIEAKPCGDLVL